MECGRNKKLELQVLLKENNIDVCCIQETHLNSCHRFSVRGNETFRRDRKDRPKWGILTLIKNTHAAAEEVYRSEDEDTEVLGIKLLLDKNPLTIYNLYLSSNKQLRAQICQPDPDRWIIKGDFNFAIDDVAKIASREVDKQLGGSDHKPIFLTIERHKLPPEIYQSPSWNFKKANWEVV